MMPVWDRTPLSGTTDCDGPCYGHCAVPDVTNSRLESWEVVVARPFGLVRLPEALATMRSVNVVTLLDDLPSDYLRVLACPTLDQLERETPHPVLQHGKNTGAKHGTRHEVGA